MRAHVFLYEQVDPTRADLSSVAEWLGVGPDEIEVHIKQEAIDKFLPQIKEMYGTYDEFPRDAARTRKIAKLLKQGATAMPMYVEENDPGLFVMEGRHRMVAFWLAGMKTVPVAYVSKVLHENSGSRQFCYHVTPEKNVKYILQHGLTPSIGSASSSYGESEERTYLFPTLDDVEGAVSSWLGDQYENDIISLLKVDVTGIQLKSDVAYEKYTNQTIPPNRITLVTKDLDAVDFSTLNETESYQPPELNVGDKILKGKFKNSPAEIKGFKKDKHNQPVLKTNKGEVQLFKPRITKLMPKKSP